MTLKSVIVVTLASSVGIFTGWATAGFAGLTVGMSEPSERASDRDAVAPRIVTGGMGPSVAAEQTAYRLRWDASLLDPNPIMQPRGRQTPARAATVETAEAADTNTGSISTGSITTGSIGPAESTDSRTAAIPLPPSRPRSEPVRTASAVAAASERRPRDTYRGNFSDAHIDRIRERLNLTADQRPYWEPVEAALRNFARRQQAQGPRAALSATESQELYWSAGPLIRRLRPDQKEEARRLARSLGLETVASLI